MRYDDRRLHRRLLLELERRGELEFSDGHPVLPYESDYFLDTVLTRDHA